MSTKASAPFTPEVRGPRQAWQVGGARCSYSTFLGAFLYLELHVDVCFLENKRRHYLSLEYHIRPQSPCPFGIWPETSWLSVEIKPVAKSILSQLINKSAGDVANDAPTEVSERKATAPGKVSAAPGLVLSPRCSCSVQAHCEFGAAAAAFAPFPSAAAPRRLFKTGYGANNFQRAHIHSTLGVGGGDTKDMGLKVGAQIRSFMPVRSGSWPRFWPPACPNYTNCTPRPP